jgi:serine/threonine-protein kinase
MSFTMDLAKTSRNLHGIDGLVFDHLMGREVGTFTMVKELGRGGMAVVFMAYQRTLKRHIAVKILPKKQLTHLAAQLFQQEAESAAILSHPNIVTIYEIGETPDFLYISMQLVRGRSLHEHIHMAKRHVLPSRRFLPLEWTIRMMTDVLNALHYAHRQDIVHRDVKPSNILIEGHTDRPIVSDFGLATMVRSTEPGRSSAVGSPAYMAPEQVLCAPVDGRTDVYGAGVMLFEAAVSKLPLPNYNTATELLKMKMALKEKLFQKKPSEMNPSLHEDMDEIVFKAVAHDPAKRYSTCAEFVADLERYRERHLETAT